MKCPKCGKEGRVHAHPCPKPGCDHQIVRCGWCEAILGREKQTA